MDTNKIRIVIDPNIIASVLIGGITRERFIWLLNHLDFFEICYSDTLLQEIRHFADVEYFKKKSITSKKIEVFIAGFISYSLKIMVTSKVKAGRYANDYFLLSLCRDSKAKYLTTGDPDLLKIEKYAKTNIVTFKTFFDLFQLI